MFERYGFDVCELNPFREKPGTFIHTPGDMNSYWGVLAVREARSLRWPGWAGR